MEFQTISAGRRFQLALSFAFLIVARSGLCAVLSIPDQIASPGQTIVAVVSFSAEGQVVSGVQLDVEWDQPLSVALFPGTSMEASAKMMYTSSPAPGTLRYLIVGMNQNLISDGGLLRIFVFLSQAAPIGTVQVRLKNALAASPDGQYVPLRVAPVNVQTQNGSATQSLQQEGILNAASLLPGPVAPGEIISVFQVLALSPVVLFNGIRSPVLYAGATQMNAVVPFGLDLSAPAAIELRDENQPSARGSVAVAPVAPAIFTLTGTGAGPGAILNQDNSVNSFSNPAAPGSIVMVYGTGFGTLRPVLADGGIVNSLATTTTPVTATIGGVPAEVTYAGSALGLVAGAVQINVRVPQGLTPAYDAAISLKIGSVATQAGVTISIQ